MRERRPGQEGCISMACDSTGIADGYLWCVRPKGHDGQHRDRGRFWDDAKETGWAYTSKRQKADFLKNGPKPRREYV